MLFWILLVSRYYLIYAFQFLDTENETRSFKYHINLEIFIHFLSHCFIVNKCDIMYINFQAEMTMKQLENLSPPIMKQVLPLVEQLPPLYMDLVNGRETFNPRPEETKRLVK